MPLSWHYGSAICGSCDVVSMTSSQAAREKAGKTPFELTDAQVMAMLQKEATKRRETAEICNKAGEDDRAAAENA